MWRKYYWGGLTVVAFTGGLVSAYQHSTSGVMLNLIALFLDLHFLNKEFTN